MADYNLGMNAKLYRGANDALIAAMTEVTNIKDLTLNLESGEADVTTRAASGWRATAPTLRECTVEFELLWKSADANFEAFRDAFINGTTVELAALDQARATSGAQGIKGNFSITNCSRSEPLEEGITVSVTAKLSKFNEWHETA